MWPSPSNAHHSVWAAAPTTTRGESTKLSSDSKGEQLAYASGNSVFLRSIDDAATARQYTGHTAKATVARFAPSGFYVASGDESGTVRVWDCVGEGITKGEHRIISGPIRDIAWDGDSQRIIAVGSGRQSLGRCITWDTGNSVGDIIGHSSQINCVAIRQQRPIRAATGSDDNGVVYYHGVPFKFNTKAHNQHKGFVHDIAYSPDGSHLASVGVDRRIWLYDGKTAEVKTLIGDGVHTGSIFGISWDKNSRRFVTASADQTVRLWDVETGTAVQTWRMGEEGVVSTPDQQVGVTWPAARSDRIVISVDLDGNLNYLADGNDTPTRVIRGHANRIISATLQDSTFFTGSYDGRIRAWDIDTGLAQHVSGEGHAKLVAGLASCADASRPKVYSVGWDDSLRTIDAHRHSYDDCKTELHFQPKAVVSSGDLALVASPYSICVIADGKEVSSRPMPYPVTCIAASRDLVAVGSEDGVVRIYQLSDTSLRDLDIELNVSKTSAISALAFSPKATYLAVGNAAGEIRVYNVKPLAWELVTDRWSTHTARVSAIAWNAAEQYAASASLDSNVYVWSVATPNKRVSFLNVHKGGVTGVAWIGAAQDKVLSTGSDATLKVLSVDGLS